jgi:glycerol uptake facilitator protein
MVSLLKRSVAEGIGTALLVYIGAGAAAITLMLSQGVKPEVTFNIGIGVLGGLADWLAIGLAFAFVIAAIIYGMGRISGAHINPAVSIALWATKRFPTLDCVTYIIAQLIGAVIGSLLFAATVGMDAVTVGGLGATSPFPGISFSQAILAEFIGTFLLMLVIMGVSVDRQATPGFAGLAIGLTVGGVITTLGNVSGASLNPARTLGPYVGDLLLGGNNLFVYLPIYLIGPIFGAVAAAFLYDWISAE